MDVLDGGAEARGMLKQVLASDHITLEAPGWTVWDGGRLLFEPESIRAAPAVLDPVPLVPLDDVGELVRLLMSAVESKQGTVVAGAALALVVLALRWFKPNMAPNHVKLATALLATLPGVAVVLLRPGVNVADIVATTVQCVVGAAGLWALVLKGPGKRMVDRRQVALALKHLGGGLNRPFRLNTPTDPQTPFAIAAMANTEIMPVDDDVKTDPDKTPAGPAPTKKE